MQIWLQNLLVILAVALCGGFLVRQGWMTLAGKKSKLGSCCSKGCGRMIRSLGLASGLFSFLLRCSVERNEAATGQAFPSI